MWPLHHSLRRLPARLLLTKQLAQRATAWKLRAMGDEYDKEIYDNLRSTSRDPLTHGILGRHFEGLDQLDLAQEHYELGVTYGANMAMPHWMLGFFYLDQPSRRAETHSAWAVYLEFAPSGRRAERAREQLGR